MITGLLHTTDQRKLRKNIGSLGQDMFLTKNSNQVFLSVVGEHDSFLYAISKVIICYFVYNVTYVTLMSRNTSHRCLQLKFMTRSTI